MIALSQFLAVFLTTFLRGRLGFLLFVFLLPFMPRYLGLSYGHGSSIDARRMLMVWLSLYFLFWLVRTKKINIVIHLIKKNRWIFIALFSLALTKSISTFSNSGLSNFLFVADDFLFSFVVVLLVMMFVRSDRGRLQLATVFVVSLLVCEIMSVVEFIKQAPLMSGVIEVAVQGTEKSLMGLSRGGVYRAAALFDNPLLLSSFVCIAWPFAWYCYRYRKEQSQIQRNFAFISLLLTPVALYFVAARSGWIVLTLTIFSFIVLNAWQHLRRTAKLLMGLCVLGILLLGAYRILDTLRAPEAYFSDASESGVSALERVHQYMIVADAIKERPLLGYGMQRDIANDLQFLEHMDSYWLRLIVEGGLISVFTFVILIWFVYRRLNLLGRLVFRPKDKQLIAVLTVSIFAFVVNLFFIAIPTNNIYLYIFIGVVVGWKIERDEHGQTKPNLNRL